MNIFLENFSMNWKSLILAAITTTVLILLVAGATGTAPPKNMYWTIVWMYFTIEAWQYWKWKSLLPYFLYLLVIITAGEIMKGSGVEYHSIPVLILLIITNIGGLIIFYILLNKWKSDSVSAKKQIYEKKFSFFLSLSLFPKKEMSRDKKSASSLFF